MMMTIQVVIFIMVIVSLVRSLPPNYEDKESAVDQAVGEKVDITQDDPQSNTIHIAHNNPKDSDIMVVQSNPFNTTIHISLNVGSGAKVAVMMTNARNIQLHISFNVMSKSECKVEILKAFNSTIHLSFQNPTNTPVKVTMDEAERSNLHVSQNIPQNSPMEVSMSAARNNQIHLSQAVPRNSPLTWRLDGDLESNQIAVNQNAGDANSPLECTPECPQEEYVYDYQYADAGHDDAQIDKAQDNNKKVDKELPHRQEIVPKQSFQGNFENSDYQQQEQPKAQDITDYSDNQHGQEDVGEHGCPGEDLEGCVDVCPGQFGARVFGFCVQTCGRRCP